MNIPTPHLEMNKLDDIAKIVIMPGDPLRAKFIAEKYLDNYKLINSTRNMYGYTGYYNGKKISIMSSGMGMPSMSIYSYELYNFYDVELIIRVGTTGGLSSDLDIYDTILVSDAYTDSNIGKNSFNVHNHILKPDLKTNKKIELISKKLNINIKKKRTYTSDSFYRTTNIDNAIKNKCDCIEMESFALFLNAKMANKKAASLLTISDTKDKITNAKEREQAFTNMIKIALEIVNY